jgi:hypothetical protein
MLWHLVAALRLESPPTSWWKEPIEFVPLSGDTLGDCGTRKTAFSMTSCGSQMAAPRGFAGLIAEGQSEPAIRQAFFDRWVSPRRAATIADLERGKNTGELRSDTEPDLLNDAIFGAIYYRFLMGLTPFSKRFGEELVEQAIRGNRAGILRS